MVRLIFALSASLVLAQEAYARPYPAQSGMSAAADSAAVAGMNPAGITRFDSRQARVEVLGFFTDNTWEGRIGDSGPTFVSEESDTTIVPAGSFITPINEDWYFGFTILGMAFSDEYASDWPGRYFILDYELLNISAFPSIAYKINEQWSVAFSVALTYSTYEQTKAVPNVDPGFGDGRLKVDTDDITGGFALSTLYEYSDKTRFGLVYRSEIDPDLDGNVEFSNLGPTTEMILDAAGLLGASINITSRQPQMINGGMYHEFADRGAVTFDVAWVDFSSFILSEIFVNGDQIVENSVNYDDIWAFSAGYSRPIGDRWMIGFGALYVDDMVSDEQRTMTLRLDDMWAAGIGLEWQWTPSRHINATVNYLQLGDAPVVTPGPTGAAQGVYTDRGTIWLQIGMNFGEGPK